MTYQAGHDKKKLEVVKMTAAGTRLERQKFFSKTLDLSSRA
nr:MAG TPA: hypothetical protein [Microviridae sp.]